MRKDTLNKIWVSISVFSICLFFCYYQVMASADNKIEGRENDMVIQSFDGVALSGVLTLPANDKVRGIIIMVHGSFVQTRDGDLDGNQTWMFPYGVPKRGLFRDITNEFITIGFGTYRYDKRASGKSGGDYQETDMVTLVKDVVSIFNVIKAQFPNIDIGLLGQSEGSLTVLKAWELGARANFIQLQGPALEPFDLTLHYQKSHAAAPFLAENLEGPLSQKFPYLAAFYHALYFEDMLEKMRRGNEKYYMLDWNGYKYRTNLKKYREYLWNGLEMLKAVTVPVYLIIGSKDTNVRPGVAQEIIEKQKIGEYQNVTVRIIEGLEHSFRKVSPGDNFVDVMAKPISQKYFEVLRSFYKQQGIYNSNCKKIF